MRWYEGVVCVEGESRAVCYISDVMSNERTNAHNTTQLNTGTSYDRLLTAIPTEFGTLNLGLMGKGWWTPEVIIRREMLMIRNEFII